MYSLPGLYRYGWDLLWIKAIDFFELFAFGMKLDMIWGFFTLDTSDLIMIPVYENGLLSSICKFFNVPMNSKGW